MIEGQESVAEAKAGGWVGDVAESQTARKAKTNVERKPRDRVNIYTWGKKYIFLNKQIQ